MHFNFTQQDYVFMKKYAGEVQTARGLVPLMVNRKSVLKMRIKYYFKPQICFLIEKLSLIYVVYTMMLEC